MNTKPKKVGLFVGSDITAHLILNKVVPEMIDSGFRPVIFMPEHKLPSPNTEKGQNARAPELKRLAFFERRLLAEVVYPYLNGLTERTKPIAPMMLAKKYGLRYFEVPNINAPDFVARQKKAKDYVGALSIRCFQIFKPEHIQAWRDKGFLINLHPGILPEYQGLMSVAREMADENQKTYGWTLHHIDEGIDTGNILSKPVTPIDRSKSVLRSTIDIADSGARAITRIFEDLNYGQFLEGTAQPPRGKGANYYSYPPPEELKAWEDAGVRLVDADEIALLYTQIFSDPATDHGKGLKEALRRAIEDEGYGFNSIGSIRGASAPTLKKTEPGLRIPA